MTGPTLDTRGASLAPAGNPAGGGAEGRRTPGNFYVLQGMIARLEQKPQSANPYPEASAERVLWLYGWGRRTWPRRVGGRMVPRETKGPGSKGPGRGRAVAGRRHEFSAREDQVLELGWDSIARGELADILGRSVQSVAARAHRLGLGEGPSGGAPGENA